MTDKEAIERMQDLIHTCDVGIEKHGEYDDLFKKDKEALVTILNIIQNQDKEIELSNRVIEKRKRNQEKLELAKILLKKDKIIDLMANEFSYKTLMYSYMTKEEVKKYFEELVENGS
jgi:hypothetical protein